MCNTILLTCFGMFLLFIDLNVAEVVKFKQENGQDISNLETDEPGFDFTEEEMKKLKIWPGGIIPYYLDTLSFDTEYRKRIDLFFNSLSNTVGVQFLKMQRPPKDESSRWVLFLNRRGVLSSGGYTTRYFTSSGVQKVILGYDSPYNGELYETTLAILGVPPQHNAPNRDEYITVKYENIMPDKKHLFDVLKDDEWLFHELDYDYFSAGHFGLHKYATGGFATIEPKDEVIDGIGDGQGFTFTDTWKIRMMYNYISKSQSKIIKKTDCLKMFKPGPKFNTVETNEPSGPGPRPKPNKYLGKPDDKDDGDSEILQEIDNSDSKKLKGGFKRPNNKKKPTRTTRTTRNTRRTRITTRRTRRTTTTPSKKEEEEEEEGDRVNIDIGDIGKKETHNVFNQENHHHYPNKLEDEQEGNHTKTLEEEEGPEEKK